MSATCFLCSSHFLSFMGINLNKNDKDNIWKILKED